MHVRIKGCYPKYIGHFCRKYILSTFVPVYRMVNTEDIMITDMEI